MKPCFSLVFVSFLHQVVVRIVSQEQRSELEKLPFNCPFISIFLVSFVEQHSVLKKVFKRPLNLFLKTGMMIQLVKVMNSNLHHPCVGSWVVDTCVSSEFIGS